MHEHGITNEVVHQILHACEDNGVKEPKRIILELGLLTGFKKDSVLLYFDNAKKEHAALANASLYIEEVPGKIRCGSCGQVSFVDPAPLYFCSFCNSTSVRVTQGKDIVIKEIHG